MEAASLRDAGLEGGSGEQGPGAGQRASRSRRHRAAKSIVVVGTGMTGNAILRNSVPRDRVLPFFSYVGIVMVAAVAVVAPLLPGLPGTAEPTPAAFWIIAFLAVAVDSRPFTAPGQGPSSTVFPSIAFTFALLLGWG